MESYSVVLEAKCDDCDAEAYWQADGTDVMKLPFRVHAQMGGEGWRRRRNHIYCPKCIANHRSERPSRATAGLKPDEIRRLESGDVTPVALARERGVTKTRIYQILKDHYGCPYSSVSPPRKCPSCASELSRGLRGRCLGCARKARLRSLLRGKCACGAAMALSARECRDCRAKRLTIYDRDSLVRLYAKIPSARCLGRYFGMSGVLPYRILNAAGVKLHRKRARFSDDEIRSAIEELAHEGFPVPDGCRLANRVCEASGAGAADADADGPHPDGRGAGGVCSGEGGG